MHPYTLGLVSISFRNKSPLEIIRAAKEAGLSCIEWGSDVHAPCRDHARLQEIAALQAEYGLTCSSYGTYFWVGQTPIEELADYIAAAKVLGTSVIRLWCGNKSGRDMTSDEWEAMVVACRDVARIAEEKGVTFCLECHRATVTERPEDAIALLEAVGSPRFRMYWQPFQWLDAAGSLEVACAVSPYAHHLHVFNWRWDERFPLADGLEAWKGYLTAFSTPRTLLLEFMPDDRIESLPTEADALRKLIGDM